jgi:hypothetical protein
MIFLAILVFLTFFPFTHEISSGMVEGESTHIFTTASWLSGWEYRKSHEIEGASNAGTNYQIKIQVEYGSGTDSGDTVYLNSHCQNDFGDIRFTDNDGITELDFWIEEYTSGDDATFWVEVEDSLDSDVQIYVYYGNSGVSTTSSGDDTFLFFDDFEDGILDSSTKWLLHDGSVEENGGTLVLRGTTGTRGFVYSRTAVSPGAVFHAKSYGSNDNLDGSRAFTATAGSGVDWSQMNDMYANDGKDQILTRTRNGGIWNEQTDTVSDYTTYHEYQTLWTSDKTVYKQDTSIIRTVTSQIPNVNQGFLFSEANQNGDDAYVDWVFIRSYVDSEPTQGSWGNEELVGSLTTTTATDTSPTTTTRGDSSLELPILAIGIPVVALFVVVLAVVYRGKLMGGASDSETYVDIPPLTEKRKREAPKNPAARKRIILGALKSYPRIGIDELSEMTGIDKAEVRDTTLSLIAEDRVSGTFDRSTDEFVSADATRTGREIKSQTEGPEGIPRCPYCGAQLEKTLGIGETGECASCGRKLMG